MSANSKIEWCDHTFNPWIGCTKVSPGCTNCYAEGESKRRGWAQWGKGKERHRTSASYWKQPLLWDRKQTSNIEHRTSNIERRRRVFCASLADWLDEEVPIEWLADLLALIHATPNLVWILLTKRPESWRRRLFEAVCHAQKSGNREAIDIALPWLDAFAPSCVWVGVSVENQKYADERIPLLLNLPAAVRFLSCEPLLGNVNLETVSSAKINALTGNFRHDLAHVDWVICGGESGPKARPMHPEWARSLRDQCAAAGVPFFFKQWGEFRPVNGVDRDSYNYDERICELNGNMWRVGKKRAGRLLDGVEYSEFPSSFRQAAETDRLAACAPQTEGVAAR